MEMHEERFEGVVALMLKGRLDSTTAPVLDQRLGAVVSMPEHRVVLDFGSLEYISSAGFRVLLVAAKRAEESNGRLVLCGLSAKVRQLFDLGGFLDIFTIAASRDDAVVSAR